MDEPKILIKIFTFHFIYSMIINFFSAITGHISIFTISKIPGLTQVDKLQLFFSNMIGFNETVYPIMNAFLLFIVFVEGLLIFSWVIRMIRGN